MARTEYNRLSTDITGSFEYGASATTGRLRFQGTPLRDTDYTILALVERTGLLPSDDRPLLWLRGDGDVEGQMTRTDLRNTNTVSISHGGSLTLTTPVQLFTGASFGVADANAGFGGIGFGDMNFLELQMYDYVPTQAQRRGLETSLMERWGL